MAVERLVLELVQDGLLTAGVWVIVLEILDDRRMAFADDVVCEGPGLRSGDRRDVNPHGVAILGYWWRAGARA